MSPAFLPLDQDDERAELAAELKVEICDDLIKILRRFDVEEDVLEAVRDYLHRDEE